jgi:hypothetical protein
MRPLRAAQQNGSVPSSGDPQVNALSSNSTVARLKSSSARMSADRLPRDSAHPSGKLRSNVLSSSVARHSNGVTMSKKNKLTDSEPWSSKPPSGEVPQNDSARQSKNGRSSAPTRRYAPEPISQ